VIGRRDILLGGAALALGGCRARHSAEPPPPSPPAAAPPAKLHDAPTIDAKRYHHLSSDLSPDRRWLALGAGAGLSTEDGPIALWDLAARRIARRALIDAGGIGLSLAGDDLLRFAPSGRFIVASTRTNGISVFDAATLEVIGEKTFDDTNDSARRAVVLPGDRELFTYGERGLVIAPIAGRHDATSRIPRWFDVAGFPTMGRIAARADGVVVGGYAEVGAFDTTTGKLRYVMTPPWRHFEPFGFSPDASVLAGASPGTVAFVDTATGRAVAAQRGGDAHAESVAWDARGLRTAVVRRAGAVEIFDAHAPLCHLDVASRDRPLIMATDLASFAFAPDGARGVVATEAGELAAFELATKPRELYRRRVVADPLEWCGVFWVAGDVIVAVTSRELVFVDARSGVIAARHPLGFPIDRDVHG
jgi:hypothetical protein